MRRSQFVCVFLFNSNTLKLAEKHLFGKTLLNLQSYTTFARHVNMQRAVKFAKPALQSYVPCWHPVPESGHAAQTGHSERTVVSAALQVVPVWDTSH